jgi:predicted nucleic acid-binding protein
LIYFDTSFLVSFIVPEPTSNAVTDLIGGLAHRELAISHWTEVEFASMLAREVRMGSYDSDAFRAAVNRLAAVTRTSFTVFLPNAADYALARDYLLQHETGLRGGDALHLAIAHNRHASAIYSLDKGLMKAGKMLGLPVTRGIS